MSGFVTPDTPNLADFLTFLATSVQIPVEALPSNSPWPGYAFNQALALTIPPGALIPGVIYSLAVYNGATHILFAITPDQPGQNYFQNARGTGTGGYGLISPTTGLVSSSSDQNTSQTLAEPVWASQLTVDQLDFYKTPWGRAFLAWNQKYGQNAWVLA